MQTLRENRGEFQGVDTDWYDPVDDAFVRRHGRWLTAKLLMLDGMQTYGSRPERREAMTHEQKNDYRHRVEVFTLFTDAHLSLDARLHREPLDAEQAARLQQMANGFPPTHEDFSVVECETLRHAARTDTLSRLALDHLPVAQHLKDGFYSGSPDFPASVYGAD